MKNKKSLMCAMMSSIVVFLTLSLPLTGASAIEGEDFGVATVVLEEGVLLNTEAADLQIRAALESLIGKQTAEEIAALANRENTTLLYDWRAGVDLAAVQVIDSRKRVPRAVTQIGPGCTVDSMCLRNGRPNGFSGSGGKAVHLSGVSKAYSGDRVGSLTPKEGPIKVLARGVTVDFFPSLDITFITRG